MTTGAPDTRGGLDLWLALLAGDSVWQDGETMPTLRDRVAASFMVVALVAVVLTQWAALAGRVEFSARTFDDGDARALLAVATAGVVAAAVLAIRPIRQVIGRANGAAPFAWSLVWRASAYFVLIAGTAAILPRLRWLGAIPLGMVGGVDALLALWALGMAPRARSWTRRFFFSTVHFGSVGALAAVALNRTFDQSGREPVVLVLGAYLAMWTGVLAGGVTVVALARLSALGEWQYQRNRADIIARERALRAHWLHDDILSEVRYTTMRIDTEHPSVANTRRELQDLDHRLRMRQLDEIVRGGRPHLYEILQPHVRRLQSLGVRVERVPPLEETERQVDEQTGNLVNRTVSVLTSNAVNAGATRMSIELHQRNAPRCLELIVCDDAGGFDLDSVPHGRGLHTLGRDLGEEGLVHEHIDGGSRMIARIRLGAESAGEGSAVSELNRA